MDDFFMANVTVYENNTVADIYNNISDTIPSPTYANCDEVSLICPIEATIYGHYFNFGANLFFAIICWLALNAHIWYAFRLKTWSFSSWIIAGGVMELIGYVARTVMHYKPWSIALLSMQICGLLWGPSLIAAGISVLFKHMVQYFGPKHSVLRYKLIPWVFIGTDLVSINVQGVGGIIAAVFTSEPGSTMAAVGENLMIAGVCSQIANMLVCGGLMLVYWRRYRKYAKAHGSYVAVGKQGSPGRRNDGAVKPFVWAVSAAYVLVAIRTCYRVAEMAGGWANPIMRDETSFLVLDAALIAIAIILLAVFHPGKWFAVVSVHSQRGNVQEKPVVRREVSDSSTEAMV